MSWINEHIADYYKWLKDRTVILSDENTGWALVNTPFVGLFNDHIELYAKKDHDLITLTDNGETFHNLDLSGVSIKRSAPRRDLVDTILLNYGVRAKGDELFVECNAGNFAQKKHNLLTAVLELNDLYVLSEPNVAYIFKEDVRQYLDEMNVIYTADFISKGTTGLEFTFDFQISKRDEEIVIKSFNSFNKTNLPVFLFSWEDIKPVRERASKKTVRAVAIVNDENKDVKSEFIDALNAKKAGSILWSQRYTDESRQKIAA
jgi:hypothetical protein